MSLKGVFGRYLEVNLSTGKMEDYPIPEIWFKKHIGGRGIAARILMEELEPGVDPLGPNNILIFATGPMQGLKVSGGGRHLLMGKSPKTNAPNGSYVGGFLAHELGTSGYDGIIIRGRAEKPRYLVVSGDHPQLKDAQELWGKDTAEVEKEIRDKEGEVRVASIGIAGEKLVKFACVIHDRNRAAGRPGFGAVLGSKKLKAVAVKGDREKEVSDPSALKEIRTEFARKLATTTQSFGKYGTAGGIMSLNELGIFPTRNFQRGKFEGAEAISGEKMYDTILTKRDTCSACTVRCKRVVETEFNGEKVRAEYGGPEYETIGALGSLCLNSNLDAIALANQKCNQYGLDTISTGVSIAFAMEASEKGLLKEEIQWGDSQAVVNLVEKIAHREGIGNLLARGVDEVSREIGADFAMSIKGQEIPMHEPRGKKGLGISYATTPRGANHMEGGHDTMFESGVLAPEIGVNEHLDRLSYRNKAQLAKIFEDLRSFNNSLVMCAFTSDMVGENYAFQEMRDFVEAITGIALTPESMLEVGERNYLLLRLLSAREGYTSQDDQLPKRFTKPLPKGGSGGEAIPEERLNSMLSQYYEERGYDEYGPTDERLAEVGLAEFKGLINRK